MTISPNVGSPGRIIAWSVCPLVLVAGVVLSMQPALGGDNEVRRIGELIGEARELLRDNRAREAVALFEGSVEAETSAAACRILGEAHLQLGHLADARRYFTGAIEMEPRCAEDHLHLGQVYLREGKCALALERLGQALELGMSNGALHLALAKAYSRMGEYLGPVRRVTVRGHSAGEVFGDILLLEPWGRGGGGGGGGETDVFLAAPSESAVYHAQRALDEELDTVEVRLLLADIWLGARYYGRAAGVYASLEERVSRSDLSKAARARIAAAWAEALYGTDDMAGYLRKLKAAAALDRAGFASALAQGYGRVAARYNQRGDLARYIRYLELAVAETPKSSTLRYRLGNAYREAGQDRRAAQEWQIALQITPNHPDRRRMLEVIQRANAEFERR